MRACRDASCKFEQEALVQLTLFLCTALTKTGKYQVVPWERLRESLVEKKKESYRQCMDASCQIELGKAVTANLYDLKAETMQKGAMVQTGCSPDELLDALGQLVEQLQDRVRRGVLFPSIVSMT